MWEEASIITKKLRQCSPLLKPSYMGTMGIAWSLQFCVPVLTSKKRIIKAYIIQEGNKNLKDLSLFHIYNINCK